MDFEDSGRSGLVSGVFLSASASELGSDEFVVDEPGSAGPAAGVTFA